MSVETTKTSRVRVGQHVLNLDGVAAAHWEKDRQALYVHLIGGRFLRFGKVEGEQLWRALVAESVDLGTGELAA